jgi:hypothetical protein
VTAPDKLRYHTCHIKQGYRYIFYGKKYGCGRGPIMMTF